MTVKKRKTPLLHDYHLLTYEELDSTNAEARRLAEGGGSHGAFIWTKRQNQGRGRYGREWISHDGNLFVSILLSPDCQPSRLSQLSFLSAVAALESISPLLPASAEARCKWPNDLLINGRKVGGLLLESFETLEVGGERKRWVIIGLGLNVESCPEHVQYPVTFLRGEGVELISPKIVLSRFIHHFMEWYGIWQEKGFPPVRKAWLQHSIGLGEEIEVRLPAEILRGIFEEIDGRGVLRLRLPSGEIRDITAGDVFLL